MSTISNERLEEYAKQEQDLVNKLFVHEDARLMAIELLALRKERERAEPVHDPNICDREVFEKGASACLVDIKKEAAETICRGISAATGCMVDWHYIGGRVHIKALCAAPPAQPVTVPDEHYHNLSELYHAQENRLFKLAQRIKGHAFDKYSHSSSQAIDVLEAAIFGESDEACRAAMLAAPGKDEIAEQAGVDPAIADAYMQGCRDAEARKAKTDTTSQQFESLAGKAVYGWIPCSERMPGIGEAVLMRISCSDHFNIESGRYKGDGLWLGCWFSTYGKKGSPYQVAHWMPIPAAPEPCK